MTRFTVRFAVMLCMFSGSAAAVPPGGSSVPECVTHVLERVMGPRQEYRIEYPQCGDAKIDSALRRYAEECASIARSEHAEAIRDMSVEKYVQEFYVGYEIFTAPRHFSVVFHEYSDGGGAHGSLATISMVFDRETSETVTLSQVFDNWEKARAALPGLIREAYAKQPGCDIVDLEKDINFNAINGDNNDPFHIGPDGLVLYFDFSSPYFWDCNPVMIDSERLLRAGAKPAFRQP